MTIRRNIWKHCLLDCKPDGRRHNRNMKNIEGVLIGPLIIQHKALVICCAALPMATVATQDCTVHTGMDMLLPLSRLLLSLSVSSLEREDPPKHLLLHSTINSHQCQEFMVSRIFSVVTILLRPLMDKFTL